MYWLKISHKSYLLTFLVPAIWTSAESLCASRTPWWTKNASSIWSFSAITSRQKTKYSMQNEMVGSKHSLEEKEDEGSKTRFTRGDKILVEVIRFGKLGATVDVVALGFDELNATGPTDPALGHGIILQKEIQYFRSGRGGLDVITGEVLPAYVENVRDASTNKLDISLRPPGGKAKAIELSQKILELLEQSPNGVLNLGDKSSPEEINAVIPGASKSAFKNAVSALYKEKKIQLGPTSVSLIQKEIG